MQDRCRLDTKEYKRNRRIKVILTSVLLFFVFCGVESSQLAILEVLRQREKAKQQSTTKTIVLTFLSFAATQKQVGEF